MTRKGPKAEDSKAERAPHDTPAPVPLEASSSDDDDAHDEAPRPAQAKRPRTSGRCDWPGAAAPEACKNVQHRVLCCKATVSPCMHAVHVHVQHC